jgi:hypothetical protein
MLCIWSSGLMYGSCYEKATDISHEQVQINAKVRWPNSVHIQLWPTCCNPSTMLGLTESRSCSIFDSIPAMFHFILHCTPFTWSKVILSSPRITSKASCYQTQTFLISNETMHAYFLPYYTKIYFQMKQCIFFMPYYSAKSQVLNYRRMVSVALMNLL